MLLFRDIQIVDTRVQSAHEINLRCIVRMGKLLRSTASLTQKNIDGL